MARKGLGKGLDSLIPDFYNEDFDSNSPQSLEDMLNDIEDDEPEDEVKVEETESIVEDDVQVEENSDDEDEEIPEESVEEVTEESNEEDVKEETAEEESVEEAVEETSDFEFNQEHVDEVKAIVDKNPRITLWSSRSSAVFRYLRKTEPEFSISKEASILIDEAVSKKYPEIWKLFED